MDNYYSRKTEPKGSTMATASLIIGIISILFILTAVLPVSIILGALAIILSHLSHIDGRLEGRAKGGFIAGLISIIVSNITILVLIIAFFTNSSFRYNIVQPMIDGFTEYYHEYFSDDYSDDAYFDFFDGDRLDHQNNYYYYNDQDSHDHI